MSPKRKTLLKVAQKAPRSHNKVSRTLTAPKTVATQPKRRGRPPRVIPTTHAGSKKSEVALPPRPPTPRPPSPHPPTPRPDTPMPPIPPSPPAYYSPTPALQELKPPLSKHALTAAPQELTSASNEQALVAGPQAITSPSDAQALVVPNNAAELPFDEYKMVYDEKFFENDEVTYISYESWTSQFHTYEVYFTVPGGPKLGIYFFTIPCGSENESNDD